MKTYKKIIAMLLTIVLFTSLTGNVFAAAENTSNEALVKLQDEYGLKTISEKDLPDGVTPLYFKTVEEANAFLQNIEKTNHRKPSILIESKQLPKLNRSTTYSGSQTVTVPGSNTILYEGQAYARYTWRYNNNGDKLFVSLDQFNATYTGITTFVSYDLLDYYWSLLDGNRTLSVTFTGETKYYLLIEGLIQYASRVDTSTVYYYRSNI